MLERMKALLRRRSMCVLATCHDNKPHCSLMGYVTDSEARTVYMVTREDTTRYLNIRENKKVSLLVDTRGEVGFEDREHLQALTVYGAYQPILDPEREAVIRKRLLERHPYLERLINHPKSVIIPIRIASFLLLDGMQKAHFEVLD